MLRTSSRAGAALAATALGLSLAAAPAMTSPAAADESTAAGCVAAGKVWLLVVTDQNKELANQCVGTPKTGTAALEAANLKLQRDKGNFLCSIGDYPAKCPASFNGQFWNYYTLTPGGKWTFSTKGADNSSPKAGSVEGWCYNAPKTKSCNMPELALTGADASASAASSAASAASSVASAAESAASSAASAASASASAAATDSAATSESPVASASSSAASTSTTSESKSSNPMGLIGALLVLAAAAAGFWGWRRSQKRAS